MTISNERVYSNTGTPWNITPTQLVSLCVAPVSNSRTFRDRYETFHGATGVPVRSQFERFAVSGRRDLHWWRERGHLHEQHLLQHGK